MALTVPTIIKTTAARLSALYLLLFALGAVLIVFYMTSLSERMLTTQTQETINEEVLGLARAYQRGGLPLLVRVVAQRSRQPSANLYLVANSNGQILSGNVRSLQPGVLDREGWSERPFHYQRYGEDELDRQRLGDAGQGVGEGAQEGRAGHNAIALVLRLPNQMIMLVGRDLGEPERLRAVVSHALMLALGIMSVGALLIWFLVGHAALKRLDSMSEASRRIMGGDLSGRLPVTGAGDEFDRLSESLNAMLARIATLNEGLKQVSDNIAHDLKTPLTRLRTRVEATLAGPEETPVYRAALEATIDEADQLIRTFNALLMIARVEAGSPDGAIGPIDIATIAADVVEFYEPVAEEAGVALTLTQDETLPMEGSRELISQALANLLDNAIKYVKSGEGGPEAPAVAVEARRIGDDVVVSVSDNGPGIPPEERMHVLQRFVRLEKSRSQPGSGLGLSLVDAVARLHHGEVAMSDAGPGLVVTLRFPVQT